MVEYHHLRSLTWQVTEKGSTGSPDSRKLSDISSPYVSLKRRLTFLAECNVKKQLLSFSLSTSLPVPSLQSVTLKSEQTLSEGFEYKSCF